MCLDLFWKESEWKQISGIRRKTPDYSGKRCSSCHGDCINIILAGKWLLKRLIRLNQVGFTIKLMIYLQWKFWRVMHRISDIGQSKISKYCDFSYVTMVIVCLKKRAIYHIMMICFLSWVIHIFARVLDSDLGSFWSCKEVLFCQVNATISVTHVQLVLNEYMVKECPEKNMTIISSSLSRVNFFHKSCGQQYG